MQLVRRRVTCRACGNNQLTLVLNFGKTPPANSFVKKKFIGLKERYFPLEVWFCKQCSMLQLGHVVNPQLLFHDYVYVSSTSPVFVRHFEMLAKDMGKKLRLKENSLVVDIGSNDGILLKPFKQKGMRVVGIEPAGNIARIARKSGIDTVTHFFDVQLAQQLVRKYGKAKLVTATNVFAHIDNLDEVVRGVQILLDDDGVFLVEVSYVGEVIKNNLFDTVYHEHVSYWSLMALRSFFNRVGMEIFDAERINTHGGSIRGLARKKSQSAMVSRVVTGIIKQEKMQRLHLISTYRLFQRRIEKNKRRFWKLMNSLKAGKYRVAGFGAPAKTTTLLHYFGVTKNQIEYIVDDSPLKQGLFTPGTHIPVVTAQVMKENQPDYVVIFAWNFADAIMKAHRRYIQLGGKFIIPVPVPKIVKNL